MSFKAKVSATDEPLPDTITKSKENGTRSAITSQTGLGVKRSVTVCVMLRVSNKIISPVPTKLVHRRDRRNQH